MLILPIVIGNVKEIRSEINNMALEKRQQDIITWLSPSDPSTNYNKALQQRHSGTGQWFLSSREYSRWKKERNSFLWLHGIPGCGKTVLSSTIVKDLQVLESESRFILYFYFDFSDASKQSFEKAVRTLISQLYHKRDDTRSQLNSLYISHENGHRQPTIQLLCNAFENMMEQAGEVFIVLDALDECQTRSELLSWMKCLLDFHQMNVHLIVTSRPEQDIRAALEKWTHSRLIIPIQSELVADDIRSYINAAVKHHDDLSRWRLRPNVQDEIEVALTKKADGM